MKSLLRNILYSVYVYILRNKVNKGLWFKVLKRPENILVIAPHPDDEVLGLGGSILQWIKEGNQLWVVFLTEGEGSGSFPDLQRIAKERRKLTFSVFMKLGIPENRLINFKLPDGKVPHVGQEGFEEAVNRLTAIIDEYQIETVFATHALDFWPNDHVACSQMAKEVVKESKRKVSLYYYWVWAWFHLKPWQFLKIDFRNYLKIDISKELDQKKALVDIYIKPTSETGIPWSGALPSILVKANTQNFELIEKIEFTDDH